MVCEYKENHAVHIDFSSNIDKSSLYEFPRELAFLRSTNFSVFDASRQFIWIIEDDNRRNSIFDTQMSASLSEFVLKCASLFGIPSKMMLRAMRMQESNLLVLLYHDVSENQFRNHLHFLDKYFNFISLDQLAHALRNHEFPNELTAAITFDDGLQSFYYEAFKVIEEVEIPVTNYVVSGVVDSEFREDFWRRRIAVAENSGFQGENMLFPQNKTRGIGASVHQGLTSEQLIELVRHRSVTIGSHSQTHPVLAETSYGTCRREIFESRRVLESLLGSEIKHFAYPYGIFTDRELQLVKEAGYVSAAGVEDIWISRKSEPFSFPRKGAGPKNGSICRLRYRIGK